MSTVAEIEAAIATLSPEDLAELMRRLDGGASDLEDADNRDVDEDGNDAWDRQMIADAKAGKFDVMIARAEADHAAGRTRPIP